MLMLTSKQIILLLLHLSHNSAHTITIHQKDDNFPLREKCQTMKTEQNTYIEVLFILETVVYLGNTIIRLICDELVLIVESVKLLYDIVAPALDARPLAQARVQTRVNLF